MIRSLLAALISLSLATGSFAADAPAAGPKSKRTAERRVKRRPAKRKPAPAPVPPAPSPAPESKADPAAKPAATAAKRPTTSADAQDLLTAFGASLAQTPAGLRLLHVRKGSPAEKLGLHATDTLLTLNGRRVRRLSGAAKALRSWKAEARLSAVVSRISNKDNDAPGRADLRGELVVLESPPLYWPRPESRDAEALTPYEAALRDDHIAAARESSKHPLAALKSPGFKVPAGEKIWIRFPKGIPQSAQTGDVLEGETSAPMASDGSLDFLVIPQGSRVWASVVSNAAEGRARVVQLAVFKIALAGGRTYPCAASVRSIAGADGAVEVSPGGSLVAAPEDDAPFLLGPERNLQIEFREDLIVLEKEDFYRAGPGLWLRSVPGGDGRSFEVSHSIPGRSAHALGVRKGDRVTHIDGRPAYRLDFSEAIRRLYGSVGTNVELKILSAEDKAPRRVKLRRGAGYRRGYGLKLSAGKAGAFVLSVDENSPAYEAGVRRGHRVDSIDGTETAGLGKAKLNDLLKAVEGKKSVRFKPRDRKARTVDLEAASYPYRRSIRSRLSEFR